MPCVLTALTKTLIILHSFHLIFFTPISSSLTRHHADYHQEMSGQVAQTQASDVTRGVKGLVCFRHSTNDHRSVRRTDSSDGVFSVAFQE
jgi:hypothetical protein